jgi:hypothetical protein
MRPPDDQYYWDELGVAWGAINPAININASRLGARLRHQSLWIGAGLVVGLPLSAAGLLLGALTIWSGWTTGTWNFVTRGIAVVMLSILLASAMSWLYAVRRSDAARAVSDMIDLAIARALRTLVAIRLGFYACIIAAVSGLVGSGIRTHLARPPAMSPVVDLTLLAFVAVGLVVYRRHTHVSLEKLRAVQRALALDGSPS